MNPKTAEKLDRSGQSHAAKISRPLDLSVFGDIHLTGSDRIIASAIRGFGRGENVAKFKYRELGARYNRSIPTIARTIRKIKDSDSFERGEKISQYKFMGGEPATKEYIEIPDWLYFIVVKDNGQEKYLTSEQIEILGYIRGFSPRGLHSSCRGIARKLHISPTTVSRAIEILSHEDNGIVEVEGDEGFEKSVNNKIRVTYRVKSSRMRQLKAQIVKYMQKGVQDKQKQIERLNAQTGYTDYYAAVQCAEEGRLNKIENDLKADRDYTDCFQGLRKSEIELAKAEALEEIEGTSEDLRERVRQITAQKERYARERRAHLERLGYCEEDLKRHFICLDCKDTGHRADGTPCDCWKRRRRTRRC